MINMEAAPPGAESVLMNIMNGHYVNTQLPNSISDYVFEKLERKLVVIQSPEFIEMLRYFNLRRVSLLALCPFYEWIPTLASQSNLEELSVGNLATLPKFIDGIGVVRISLLLNSVISFNSRDTMRHLDLNGISYLKIDDFYEIREILRKLESLMVCGVTLLDDHFRVICNQFHSLRRLDISDTTLVSIIGIRELINLEVLWMRNLDLAPGHRGVHELCSLENLLELDISRTRNGKSIKLFNVFNKYGIQLRNLEIFDCSGTDITEDNLNSIRVFFPALTTVFAFRSTIIAQSYHPLTVWFTSDLMHMINALEHYIPRKRIPELDWIIETCRHIDVLEQAPRLGAEYQRRYILLLCQTILCFPYAPFHYGSVCCLQAIPKFVIYTSEIQVIEQIVETLLICIEQWLICRSDMKTFVMSACWEFLDDKEIWNTRVNLEETCFLAQKYVMMEGDVNTTFPAISVFGQLMDRMSWNALQDVLNNYGYWSYLISLMKINDADELGVNFIVWTRIIYGISWTLMKLSEWSPLVCNTMPVLGVIRDLFRFLSEPNYDNRIRNVWLRMLWNILFNGTICSRNEVCLEQNVNILITLYRLNNEEINNLRSNLIYIEINHIILWIFAFILHHYSAIPYDLWNEMNQFLMDPVTSQVNLLPENRVLFGENSWLKKFLKRGHWSGPVAWALTMVKRRKLRNENVDTFFPSIRAVRNEEQGIQQLKNDILNENR